LLASSFKDTIPITKWFFNNSKNYMELPFVIKANPDENYNFSTKIYLKNHSNAKWLLKISVSGTALLKLNGKTHQGIDPTHKFTFIPSGKHEIELLATPRGLFRENPWVFTFDHALAIASNWKGVSLAIGMFELFRLARASTGQFKEDLLKALEDSLIEFDIVPSILQIYAADSIFSGNIESRWDRSYIASVYGVPVSLGIYKDIQNSTDINADKKIDQAYDIFESKLRELREKYPKIGSMIFLAHCHIDAAWLWPYSETKKKVIKSFANVHKLFQEGYEFTFVQSSAQYYEWLGEIDEKMLNKIKEYVSNNLWLPVGGMWIEPDTNLITGESLARQLLLGQLYFEKEFNRIAKIGWIPDSFGFSAQLPQIMKKGGIEVFVTHKIMWNDTNKFPYHLFIWEGIDGTRIPVHVLVANYNGSANSDEVMKTWENYAQKDLGPAIYAYGFGDGGGGPNAIMLEKISWLKKFPKIPNIKEKIKEEEYVSLLNSSLNKAPIWKGELYVEIHRGTYTTNHKIKELVSRTESYIRSAEIWSSIVFANGKDYPQELLNDAWKKLLRAEFHDVLPGSANYEAYEEAYRDLEEAMNTSEKVLNNALNSLINSDQEAYSIILFNDLPWTRKEIIKLPKFYELKVQGLETQEIDGNLAIMVNLPPLGYCSIEKSCIEDSSSKIYTKEINDQIILGNGIIEVWINEDGSFKIFDKELNTEILKEQRLEAHQDKPGSWDAWDIEKSSFEIPSINIKAIEKPRIIAKGPIIASAEFKASFKGSSILQRISVMKGSRLVEIFMKIDWNSRGYLLKSWFTPAFEFKEACFEIPFGVIKRKAKELDAWEEAKFEAPALRWIDVSDKSKGIAIIAFSKHGYSIRNNRIGLTLLKVPIFPNPYNSKESFEFSYYIYVHENDYVNSEVPKIAYNLWSPVKFLFTRKKPKKDSESFIEIKGKSTILEAIKKAEKSDDIVLRIYEIGGRNEEVEIILWDEFKIYETNLLEKDQRFIGLYKRFKIQLKPFEIKTLILRKL